MSDASGGVIRHTKTGSTIKAGIILAINTAVPTALAAARNGCNMSLPPVLRCSLLDVHGRTGFAVLVSSPPLVVGGGLRVRTHPPTTTGDMKTIAALAMSAALAFSPAITDWNSATADNTGAPQGAYTTDHGRTGWFGGAWFDVDGNGCDTRNDILARDLTDVTFKNGVNLCGDIRTPGRPLHRKDHRVQTR